MVTVHFKLSNQNSVQLDIAVPAKFDKVLELCAVATGTAIGSVIAVRDGRVLSLHEMVTVADVIDVYPAISGG